MATVQDTRSGIDTRDTEPRHTKVPLRLITLAILTGGLVVLSMLIALPFLNALTWGAALAIIGWPMHRLIRERIASPTGAAILSTVIVALLIVLPMVFVIYQVGRETAALTTQTEGAPGAPGELVKRETLEKVPGVRRVVVWMDRVNLDIETEARKLVTAFLPTVDGLAQGSILVFVQFLVAMFILFYVFRDRGEFMQGLRELLPLTRSEGDRVLVSAADSVYANLYATVVTSLINSISFGMLFWYVGIRAPALWGAVMFVLSILPVVGAGMIWFPVGMYFALTENWTSAAILLGWGLFTAVFIDYILYARIAGGRMRMHPVPALVAFLGGLAVFGLSGIILGPAIVAMTSAMLDLWRERNEGTGSALTDAV